MNKKSLCVLIALIALLTALVPASASFDLSFDPGDAYGDPSLKPMELQYGQTVSVEPYYGCYTVDPAVPECEGKIFVGWQLDADERTAAQVRYLEVGTDREIAPTLIEEDLEAGTFYPATAIVIRGYELIGSDTQELLLKKGGPTATDPWKNTITFYYLKQVIR